MTRTIGSILAIVCILTIPTQAQQSVPKPTVADAAKVVKIIVSDKTKIATYCELMNLNEEIDEVAVIEDNSKLAQLNKQAEDLAKALGPEFVRLSVGLDQVDMRSEEGVELVTELEKLDDLCPRK